MFAKALLILYLLHTEVLYLNKIKTAPDFVSKMDDRINNLIVDLWLN